MKFRTTVVLLVVTSTLIFVGPIGIYVVHFHGQPLSDNPADWGVLGDYFAGTIGTLLGLVNLWVVIYIALLIHRLESQREQSTTEKLARPYCLLHAGDFEDELF